ncbi:MAG: Flp pilus assembly complex ATPase component TadA [Coprobacillus sp.]|nr:Flp pilus assembly complex ATPase component TadA [Coprobacillus sp.]
MKSLPIGEVLKEYGYINEEQLQIALDAQKKDRSKRLGEHLIDLGFVSEQQMLEALSDKLAEPLVSLDNIDFDINAVKKIPEAMAQKYNVIGYAFNDNVLTVATSDPLNYYGLEDVRLVSGCRISVSLATKADIQIAIERYYSDVDTLNLVDDIDESTLPEVEEDLNLFDANEDDTPVVKLLNSLLIRGYNTSASDIHIEPFEEKLHVRMRIDGMLVDYLDLNKNIQAALIVRIKILSNMDIFGEKIVMRYLNSNSTIDRLSTFGMTEENFNKMNHMMSMPHGIIYVTGPTGSGKTTTLYMILEKLAQGQINISTIEDPVERKLNRINQMQVNTMSGLTFDRGLRALMRQDPDVIMVGETRDKETAEISVRAAITGHLVVSTLHTNDAISTIVRLEEMGVEPYMVANSLVGVVAQRLMRKVCPYCKKEVATSLSDRLALQEGIKYISKGTGCPHCNQTGYKGRIAIHEVIEIDSKVRKMISNQEEIDDIMKYLVEEQGVETLRDQALKLVKEGKTTVDEFNKIIAYID